MENKAPGLAGLLFDQGSCGPYEPLHLVSKTDRLLVRFAIQSTRSSHRHSNRRLPIRRQHPKMLEGGLLPPLDPPRVGEANANHLAAGARGPQQTPQQRKGRTSSPGKRAALGKKDHRVCRRAGPDGSSGLLPHHWIRRSGPRTTSPPALPTWPTNRPSERRPLG